MGNIIYDSVVIILLVLAIYTFFTDSAYQEIMQKIGESFYSILKIVMTILLISFFGWLLIYMFSSSSDVCFFITSDDCG